MSICVLGSKALQSHGLLDREPADMDLLCTYEEMVSFNSDIKMKKCYPFDSGKKYYTESICGDIYETEVAWEGTLSEELMQLIESDADTYEVGNYLFPSIHVLYMLKMSHRYLKNSPHFLKTMQDIRTLRLAGATIRPEHREFYDKRVAETYNYSHPSLMRSKKDFFSGDGIEYVWDHDTIHEAVKFMERPAYTFFQSDEVMVDMDKFETLPNHIKLYAVLEESLVLAAERSQLAFPHSEIDTEWSFKTALMKVCTSITSGRFREYAWENYNDVVSLYNIVGKNYMSRVYEGICDGVVKKVEGR